MVKNPHVNAGDVGSIPGSGRSPGEGNGYPLQYSCLENSMNRATWRAIVPGVAELDMTEHTHTHKASFLLILQSQLNSILDLLPLNPLEFSRVTGFLGTQPLGKLILHSFKDL